MPMAGHLAHMARALFRNASAITTHARAAANVEAADADDAYFKATGKQGMYR